MNKIKNIGKSIIISGIVVPALGILAHMMPGKGAFAEDDASLSHRFECAYKFNPNPEHREYTSYEYQNANSYPRYVHEDGGICKPIDSETGYVYQDGWIEPYGQYDKLCHTETYGATPWMIYPLHVLVAGLAYARLRRREQELAARNQPYVRPNITR